MNDENSVNREAHLEAFTAELTAAAYYVALRHRGGKAWLDLQLDLWQVLTETVKKWGGGDSRGVT